MAKKKRILTSRSLQQLVTPPPFAIYKRILIPNSGYMVLWDISPLSSRSAGFLNKVAVSCPNNSSLDLLPVMQ